MSLREHLSQQIEQIKLLDTHEHIRPQHSQAVSYIS